MSQNLPTIKNELAKILTTFNPTPAPAPKVIYSSNLVTGFNTIKQLPEQFNTTDVPFIMITSPLGQKQPYGWENMGQARHDTVIRLVCVIGSRQRALWRLVPDMDYWPDALASLLHGHITLNGSCQFVGKDAGARNLTFEWTPTAIKDNGVDYLGAIVDVPVTYLQVQTFIS